MSHAGSDHAAAHAFKKTENTDDEYMNSSENGKKKKKRKISRYLYPAFSAAFESQKKHLKMVVGGYCLFVWFFLKEEEASESSNIQSVEWI